MRTTAKALAFLAALLPSLAVAQTQLPTLPANTVLGRLGVSAGPAQAIPFSQLGPTLITSNLAVTAPLSISGLNLSITGASGQILAGTPPAFTLTPTLGVPSTSTGSLAFATSGGSGKVTVQAPTTSTNWTFKFPTTAGSNGQALTTDGNGNTSWSAGAGTVNSGTAGQLAYYATSAAAISGNPNLTVSSGTLTIGVAGSQAGTLALSGATSGTTTLTPQAVASGALTLPLGPDTLVSANGVQTLTSKTLTSPTINSATMTTPTLGVASATSINKVAITAPATGSTLTIADGKTLTDTSAIGASVLLGATGGGFSAYGGASCTNQFVRSLSAAAAATCASVANTDLANSSITIGSTNVALGATASTVAGLTLTSPTVNGGTAQALTNLGIRSSGSGAFDMVLANTENLTAQRTLTLTLNNAARSFNLSGNLTLGSDLITSGANAITLTTTGATNVTMPTSGTLATINTAQTFSGQNIFSALQQFSDVKFSSGKLYPTADSTTAMQVCKADGVTCFGTFDSTNQAANFSTLKFTTLDAASLGSSTSTVTGLTVNNSPSSSNDYIPYYSAADGKIRKATVGSIAAGATAGVSSLNGLTGGLSIAQGNGVQVSAAGSSVTVSANTPTPGGRLTLTSATPVLTTSVTAGGTLYYALYAGDTVPLYDGTNMVPTTYTEMSAVLGSNWSATTNYDWYIGSDSGTIRLCSGAAWTNSTTRSETHARVKGLLLNNASMTCRYSNTSTFTCAASRCTYVGTTRTTGAGQIDFIFGAASSGGTAAVFNVWNAFNRVNVGTTVTDTSATHTYTSATIRQWGASAGMQVSFLTGYAEDTFVTQANGQASTVAAVNASASFGVGYDATNAFSAQNFQIFNFAAAAQLTGGGVNMQKTDIGSHVFSLNEKSDGTNANNFNNASLANLVFSGRM